MECSYQASGRTQLHGDWSHLQGIPSRVGGRGEAPLEPPAAHSSLTMIIKISSCDAHSDESKHPTHLHLRILRRASSTADRRSTRTGRSRIPRPPPAPAVPTARFRARRPSPPEPFPRRSSSALDPAPAGSGRKRGTNVPGAASRPRAAPHRAAATPVAVRPPRRRGDAWSFHRYAGHRLSERRAGRYARPPYIIASARGEQVDGAATGGLDQETKEITMVYRRKSRKAACCNHGRPSSSSWPPAAITEGHGKAAIEEGRFRGDWMQSRKEGSCELKLPGQSDCGYR